LLLIYLFGAVILSVGLYRVLLRGLSYLYTATYYYAITSFLLLALAAVLLSWVLDLLGSARRRVMLKAVTAAALAALVGVSYMSIQERIGPNAPGLFRWAEDQVGLDRALRSQDRYYLAGIAPGPHAPLWQRYEPLLLNEHYRARGERIPGYLMTDASGEVWLAEVRSGDLGKQLSGACVAMASSPRFTRQGATYVSTDPTGGLAEGQGFLLSEESYLPTDFRVTIRNPTHGGLVFNYRDPQNFLLFVIDHMLVYCHKMENGKLSPRLLQRPLPRLGPEMTVCVRYLDGAAYVFANEYLLSWIAEGAQHPGRIGFFAQENGAQAEMFTGPIIVDHGESAAHRPLFYPTLWVAPPSAEE
jgi:hypothetical protein